MRLFFKKERIFTLAKITGVVVLIIPNIPTRIKEWAYAGFGITFISASIAHFSSGDPVSIAITPLIFLAILIVSNIYLHKLKQVKMDSTERAYLLSKAAPGYS